MIYGELRWRPLTDEEIDTLTDEELTELQRDYEHQCGAYDEYIELQAEKNRERWEAEEEGNG
ncbi:MAG: hypothetical protein WD492_12795 [Alkalispirochaeta sp.]